MALPFYICTAIMGSNVAASHFPEMIFSEVRQATLPNLNGKNESISSLMRKALYRQTFYSKNWEDRVAALMEKLKAVAASRKLFSVLFLSLREAARKN